MTFGEKLQFLRKQNGLSQEQLASQLTVSRQAVSKWELDSSLPDTENIVQISSIFNISIDYLLKEDIEQTSNLPAQDKIPTIKTQRGISAKLMIFVGAIGVLVFWILSSVFPAVTSVAQVSANGDESRTIIKTGLPAFLEINNMELLFILCCFVFLVGLTLFCYTIIKSKRKRVK